MLYSLKALMEGKAGRYAEALTALERGELLCAPIRKKSWSSVHLLAKALLGERMERDPRAREAWGGVLTRPARDYAREAASLFDALGVRIHTYPFSKERVYKAVQMGKRGETDLWEYPYAQEQSYKSAIKEWL